MIDVEEQREPNGVLEGERNRTPRDGIQAGREGVGGGGKRLEVSWTPAVREGRVPRRRRKVGRKGEVYQGRGRGPGGDGDEAGRERDLGGRTCGRMGCNARLEISGSAGEGGKGAVGGRHVPRWHAGKEREGTRDGWKSPCLERNAHFLGIRACDSRQKLTWIGAEKQRFLDLGFCAGIMGVGGAVLYDGEEQSQLAVRDDFEGEVVLFRAVVSSGPKP